MQDPHQTCPGCDGLEVSQWDNCTQYVARKLDHPSLPFEDPG